jgi:hypothetical protein
MEIKSLAWGGGKLKAGITSQRQVKNFTNLESYLTWDEGSLKKINI